MTHSPDYIKGAIAALNDVKAVCLATATHVGILRGKEDAESIKAVFDGITDPLITKYKDMQKGPL